VACCEGLSRGVTEGRSVNRFSFNCRESDVYDSRLPIYRQLDSNRVVGMTGMRKQEFAFAGQ
jgi:hypothetical protein